MAMKFSHAVGYRGKASIDGSPLLCTGGNINLTQDPIMGSGVWGAGYQNVAPIAYAWNYLQLEGSANFELTTGDEWGALKRFAFTNRQNATLIVLLPDGINGFSGSGWCSGLSFEASEGAAITGSVNFKGDPSGNNITGGSAENTSSMGGYTSFAGNTLCAYWGAKMVGSGAPEDVISWSCSYNSDIQFLKCCKGESSAPLAADYILLGEQTGDGSFTTFKIINEFQPKNYHNEIANLQFYVNTERYIGIAKAIVNSRSTSMATGASYITSQHSFTALGDGSKALFDMSGGSSD